MWVGKHGCLGGGAAVADELPRLVANRCLPPLAATRHGFYAGIALGLVAAANAVVVAVRTQTLRATVM